MKALAVADVRAAVAREWERFIARLPAADDGPGWRVATRCQGWTVSDLAVHAVWGISMEADALRRAGAGRREPAEGRTLDPARAGPEEIVSGLVAARQALLDELAVLDDHDGERIVPLPYGELPRALFLPILVMEAGIHADDLAAGGDAAAPLADDVVVATTNFLVTFLPVLAAGASATPPAGTVVALRGATVDLRLRFGDGRWSAADAGDPLPGPSGTGDAGAVVAAEDDSTILRFALGRLAADDSRLSFSGPGRAFKRWFPGP
ncbi:MAG: maleylpyruvate isomerase N-terminal domain-containing protein [Actinomycetota bacterium]|jgi:uncharacterized protein (TIGR03083 family)